MKKSTHKTFQGRSWILLTAAAVAIGFFGMPGFSGKAHSATLFSQGLPASNASSPGPSDKDSGGYYIAKFVLAEDSTIESIDWVGAYIGDDQIASDSFNVVILGDDSDAPDSSDIKVNTGVSPTRTDSGADLFETDLYNYSASISPLMLPAGTYWLSIANDTTGDSDDWNWMATNNTSAPASFSPNTQTSGYQAPFDFELMFAINGTSGSSFKIEDIMYDPGTDTITLQWESTPGENYAIYYSQDPASISTQGSSAVNAAAASSSTSHSFSNPAPSSDKLFFSVKQNE